MAQRCDDQCRGDAALSDLRHPYAYATRSEGSIAVLPGTEISGPDSDRARPRCERLGWDAHAAFVDSLADQGAVVLGDSGRGPADSSAVTSVLSLARLRGPARPSPSGRRSHRTPNVQTCAVTLDESHALHAPANAADLVGAVDP